MAATRFLAGLLSAGLVIGSIPFARAERLEGPCQMVEGICYRSLDERVSSARQAHYLSGAPASPLGWLEHDLASGQTRRLPPGASGLVPIGPQPPAGSTWVPRVLSIVTRPWLDVFFRTLVKIEARFPQQPAGTVSLCSGTLVGSHTILTAGHCIFSHDYGGWALDLWAYPAMAGHHDTPYGEASAASLVSTDWWAVDHDHRGDTGIIRLNENVGDLTGWPQLVWGYSSLSGTIHAAGYPSEDSYDGQWLYADSGSVQSLTDYLICHSMATRRGMSGGPGWLDDQGVERVTAVNSYCEQGGLCCMARYLDLVDQQRSSSEAEPAGQPPEHWNCDLARYASQAGCDCLCGVWDPDCEQADQPADGCQAGERCIRPGVCICAPECAGLDCGPDGCGGVCGWCDPGTSCQAGHCDCQPTCAGRQCGSDGCDGSCGQCPPGTTCQGGSCVCSPDCDGKECGPDGCGGVCGQCDPGLGCVSGSCACVPSCGDRGCGPDGCGGDCGGCAGDQECVEGRCVCTYNCIDRECGSDGCGGSCGSCQIGDVCQAGRCVGEGSSDGSGCGCGSAPGAGFGLVAGLLGLLGLFWLAFTRRRRGQRPGGESITARSA